MALLINRIYRFVHNSYLVTSYSSPNNRKYSANLNLWLAECHFFISMILFFQSTVKLKVLSRKKWGKDLALLRKIGSKKCNLQLRGPIKNKDRRVSQIYIYIL